MFTGKILRQALEKFLKGEAAGNARVQVLLPNGEFYDIVGIKLLENKIIGSMETHRLVLTCDKPKLKMGKILKIV